MARQHERAKAAERREQAEVRAAGLQREARRWFIRAVLALMVAGLIWWLSVVVAVLFVLAAVGCVVQGMRLAVSAVRAVER
ncbi:MAG: hypothetical protein JWO02_4068 [Solirubrobacterales bacterium]|nr:hypothetical protein [Solirubrobacterales bacterium]